MTWHDYLSSHAIEAPDIEDFDDGVIVPFGECNLDLNAASIRTSENQAHMLIARQRQPDEHGLNVVMTLIFLDSRLRNAEGPLPQELADDMFIRAVRNAVLRINQHRGTLISESAIEQACNAAREALRDLAEQAGVVRRHDRDTTNGANGEVSTIDRPENAGEDSDPRRKGSEADE